MRGTEGQVLPLTHAQRVARFGSFSFTASPRPGNPEAVTIDPDWIVQNVRTVVCPQLERLGVGPVRIHRLAADSFLELWNAWERSDLLDIVETWNGSHVSRFKRPGPGPDGKPLTILQRIERARTLGAASLSNHSWASAFDINARLYPLGKHAPASATIWKLVPDAERLGWFPGAKFRSKPDPMHFEYTGAPPARDELAAARALLDGKLTRAQRRAAQETLGLTPDGVIGPKTLARAREVLGVK